jgi:hypothetical protein
MEINDQPTIEGVQKRLEAAGITIDSIAACRFGKTAFYSAIRRPSSADQ